MDFITDLFLKTVLQVWTTFLHNWPFLLVSVLIAVALKLYIDPNKVSAFLIRYRRAGVIGATVAAVATPLCSCGTTAIILGMMAGMMPWAPIVAFMVASPLTSPEELIYSAGLFGWPFALAFYISSILLGLLGGLAAGWMENRGWLANQARLSVGSGTRQPVPQASFSNPARRFEPVLVSHNLDTASITGCGCGTAPVDRAVPAAVPAPVLTTCGCGSPASAPAPTSCGCGSAVSIPGSTDCGCDSAVSAAASTCCGYESTVSVPVSTGCGCGSAVSAPAPMGCGCGSSTAAIIPDTGTSESTSSSASGCSSGACSTNAKAPVTLGLFLSEALSTSRRLLVMFFGFAFIGYFLNGLIPQEWVAAVFGSGNAYSVPLAATLGLPLYINSEASLPLVRALIDGGMSQGAALAFLITGAGTSIGALAGALTIARWRVIGLVIGTLWVGAVVLGYLYNILLASGLV